jgi:hypothetical protein
MVVDDTEAIVGDRRGENGVRGGGLEPPRFSTPDPETEEA